jgi:hypothetical protein
MERVNNARLGSTDFAAWTQEGDPVAHYTAPPFKKTDFIRDRQNQSGHSAVAPLLTQSTIIRDVFTKAVTLLRAMLVDSQTLRARNDLYKTTKKCLQRFHLWGTGHGVPSGDLDVFLQNSKEIYDSVLSLLVSIVELLFYGQSSVDNFWDKNVLTCPDLLPITLSRVLKDYDVLVDSDVEALIEFSRAALSIPENRELRESVEDMEDVIASLENDVECLSYLSSAIESPALDRPENHVQTLDYSAATSKHSHYSEIIRSKFPSAQSSLIEQLAITSWHRYQHICQQRVREEPQELGNPSLSNSGESKPRFRDSGLGSSAYIMQNASAWLEDAMTVVSRRAASSHKHLPSLSAEARAGQPFTCEVCYRVVIVNRTRDWK